MMHDDWGAQDPRYTGIRSDLVRIDGTRVHLLRADPVEATDDLPVLLVHGLGGSSTNWLEVIPTLAATTPVVAVDLPGFSHTRPPSTRAARIVPQVAFLARLLDELGWDRVELHGNSLGGLLAILLAGRDPARVGRLVLTAPAYPAAVPDGIASLNADSARVFLPFLVSEQVGLRMLRGLYRRTTPEQLLERTQRLVMPPDTALPEPMRAIGLEHARDAMRLPWRAEGLAAASSDMLRVLTVRRRMVHAATAAVTAPILLLWGDQDRLVSRAMVDALTARRGDLARVDIAGAGHVPMLGMPRRWLDEVTAWRDLVGASSARTADSSSDA